MINQLSGSALDVLQKTSGDNKVLALALKKTISTENILFTNMFFKSAPAAKDFEYLSKDGVVKADYIFLDEGSPTNNIGYLKKVEPFSWIGSGSVVHVEETKLGMGVDPTEYLISHSEDCVASIKKQYAQGFMGILVEKNR